MSTLVHETPEREFLCLNDWLSGGSNPLTSGFADRGRGGIIIGNGGRIQFKADI